MKTNHINRVASIGFGHLCLREENMSFNISCIFQEREISIIIYLINHVSAETLTTGRMIRNPWDKQYTNRGIDIMIVQMQIPNFVCMLKALIKEIQTMNDRWEQETKHIRCHYFGKNIWYAIIQKSTSLHSSVSGIEILLSLFHEHDM